jgi:pimeloyl-ACP methyl ester carboxylesterase
MLNFKTFETSLALPWIVFIHGAGGSSSIWYKQVKDFSARFNVLLIDLRGHGDSSKEGNEKKSYNFESITQEIIEVLDYKNITSAHFIGISLGTIIIRELAELQPNRIRTMILGGAVVHINFKGRVLMSLGNWFKSLLPYMVLYRLVAWVLMPRTNHRSARNLFIEQAKKLAQKEFVRWYRLTATVGNILKLHREKINPIPTLYIMGSEDHMFLDSIEKLVTRHKNSILEVVRNSGHVVNVDQPKHFNSISINYIDNFESLAFK